LQFHHELCASGSLFCFNREPKQKSFSMHRCAVIMLYSWCAQCDWLLHGCPGYQAQQCSYQAQQCSYQAQQCSSTAPGLQSARELMGNTQSTNYMTSSSTGCSPPQLGHRTRCCCLPMVVVSLRADHYHVVHHDS
jgi:hypothetical protein